MCGLVGVAGKIFSSEKKAFKFLHQFDTIRGEHSSGMAVIGDKGSTKVLKKVGIPWDLWAGYPDEFDAKDHVYKSMDAKVMIGHNRYATVGAKVDENAHPFQHGHIIGAHNGTLSSHWLHKLDGNNMFEVDSEAIFYSLNKNGLEKTIKTLHGAWALTWWDAKNNTVNFLRNSERPLHYLWNKHHDVMFWASEPWMLLAATHLAKIDTGEEKVHSFTADRLYTLNMNPNKNEIEDKTIYYSTEKYEGFQPPVFSGVKGKGTGYYQSWENYYGSEDYWSNHSNFSNSGYRPPEVKGGQKSTTNTDKDDNKVDTKTFDNITKDKQKALDLINKKVEFWIYGERASQHAGTYLLADCHGLPDSYEIRIYCSGHERFKEWQESNLHYHGELKSVTSVWNNKTNKMDRYIIMDLRSIDKGFDPDMKIITKETVKKEEKKDNVVQLPVKREPTIILPSDLEWNTSRDYNGYLGRKLSFSEMMQAVNRGCISCGEKIGASEADDVLFVQAGRFLCPICKNNQETVNYYMPNTNKNLK